MDNPCPAPTSVSGEELRRCRDRRRAPLRTDDTLAVFTYKLQQVVGAPVYWWAEDDGEEVPMVEGGSARVSRCGLGSVLGHVV
jgi:hypothetical protein